MSPLARRKAARTLLVLSVLAWGLCRFAYWRGWIDKATLDQITNDLSWFAIVLTAVDILATSDVRAEQDEDTSEIKDCCPTCGK